MMQTGISAELDSRGRSIWPKGKLFGLLGIILVYALLAFSFKALVARGYVDKMPVTKLAQEDNSTSFLTHKVADESLSAAYSFFRKNLLMQNGHINLYWTVSQNKSIGAQANTNSEAISYYLLWAAKAKDKKAFDKELDYLEKYMLEPRHGYMMWHLLPNGTPTKDGTNIASDADLRAIKALLIAEKEWGDKRYARLIENLAGGLENLAITYDGLFAPYGGVSGHDSFWSAKEVYLSYSDFGVFRELARRMDEPWISLQDKMKTLTLSAQIHNGLYNSQLTEQRQYGNGIDDGGYSINSLWIMVRGAESNDPLLMQSARKSLEFYKSQYKHSNQLYLTYGSNGDALSSFDSPWVYALVGRAAVALGDMDFADAMIAKLIEKQVTDRNSSLYGAFPEGTGSNLVVGQFTMQESILTLQDYAAARIQRENVSN